MNSLTVEYYYLTRAVLDPGVRHTNEQHTLVFYMIIIPFVSHEINTIF